MSHQYASLFLILFALCYVSNGHKIDIPCLDETCIKISAEILTKRDKSVSPCDNFYEYACNGWIKNNRIPEGHRTYSVLDKLFQDSDYFTKELLENTSHTDISHGFKSAQMYYESCMDERLIERRGLDPVYQYINTLFGGWSLLSTNQIMDESFLTVEKFDLTKLYTKLFKYFGSTPLCAISVEADETNPSLFTLEMYEGSLSLDREYYIYDTFPLYSKITNDYRNFMHKYAELLGVTEDKVKELDDVYEFEKQIALVTELDYEYDHKLITVGDLSTICPVINWKLLLQSLYNSLNYTITDNHSIAVLDRQLISKRCELYEKFLKSNETIRILHNSAIWSFLWKTVTKLTKQVTELLHGYTEIESSLKIEPVRWRTCVKEVHDIFGDVIGRKFVEQKFGQKSKDAITEMISEIKQIFKQMFADVSWIEESDKLKAIEKLDQMKTSVGYPENIDDINEENKRYQSIQNMSELTYFENNLYGRKSIHITRLLQLITQKEGSWQFQANTVIAFYEHNSNHIYFPAGILQSPLYHPDYPLALNLAGVGVLIGHEITHAFDQHGATFNDKGNLTNLWSAETMDQMYENNKCMISQYNNYSILNTNLNGILTLNENIADNSGLKVAYRAFKKLEAKYADTPKLPGLDFTPDQLFFIGFAQLGCFKSLPDETLKWLYASSHSIPPYRVIGALSNSEEFSRAFNCPSGSFMNPKRKCQFW